MFKYKFLITYSCEHYLQFSGLGSFLGYFTNHLKPMRVNLWGYPIFPAFAPADISSSKNPYPTYLFPAIFFRKQELLLQVQN